MVEVSFILENNLAAGEVSDTAEIGCDTRECPAMFPECVMIHALAFIRGMIRQVSQIRPRLCFSHAQNPFD